MINRFFLVASLFVLGGLSSLGAEPLRVFIRGGQSNRGQEVHAHPRFLGEWTTLLTERGLSVSGGMEFPTAEQLAQADVLVMYAQEGGDIPEEKRPGLEAFLKRGGGIVVIHTASVPLNQPGRSAYLKSVIGGSWVWGQTKWLEGPMSLYYTDRTHPITTGVANFDLEDEIYYDMDVDPAAHVLAAAYTPNITTRREDKRGQPARGKVTVYDIAPQMWTFEKTLEGGKPYRAFVSLPGHQFKTFNLPQYRAVLLRGIAWAGRRSSIDEFARPEELASLRYPEGGPQRPGQSRAQMEVHPEFKVSIVASEPLFNKAMNIDWDAQGRLWICETPEYPDGRFANAPSDLVQRWIDAPVGADGRYERPAHDKISILTDSDGDGVMDRKHVFHEGLELVTSFVLHRDGVIASAAPDIWLLRDTDGDGKADRTEKLYTGLGTRDTHAVINNLRWGFDGWIYATHGYSSTPKVTNGDGSKDFGGINSGVVRFKPDGSAFEQFSSKGGNTWGLQVSWDNEIFWTQPTSGDLLMHTVMSEAQMSRSGVKGLPGYRVVSKSLQVFPLIDYEDLPYVQIDWVGKFTAAAGAVIYDGGAWPAKWNYGYFTTEPTINIVHHQIVGAEGASYAAHREPGREEKEFIGGKDMWFRPIEVRTGPDGAVYVVDFYNQAVMHNDTRGPKHGPRNAAIRPDRDHYYGRIWRVSHQDARLIEVPNLAKASPQELVAALEHVNQHVRMNALRLLVERNAADAADALGQLVRSQKPPQSRVAALWTMARMGHLDGATLTAASNDPSEALRKNAMRVAAARPAPATVPALEQASRAAALKLAADPNPQVQLQAFHALAALPADAATANALVPLYLRLEDRHLRAAFMIVANLAPAEFLNAAFAAGNPQAFAPLVASLTSALVGARPDDAGRLVISLADKPASQDSLKQALLNVLASAPAPGWSAPLEQALRTLLASSNPGVASASLPLAAGWDKEGALAADVKRQVASLTQKLSDKSLTDEARVAIATSLLGVRQGHPDVLPAVAGLLGGDSAPSLQRRVVDALGALPDDAVGAMLVKTLPQLAGEPQSAALDQLLKRPAWAMALVDALDNGSISFALLGPANAHRLRLHPDAKVSSRAATVIEKLRGPEAKEKAALIARLTPEVEKPGNAAKGKELFTANCATCHQFGGAGQLVGPALDGMGAHGPAVLLGQILDPNREVDLAYVAVSVETKDGELYDGIVTRENPAMIALRNASGEKEIAKSQIATRRNTGRSLMPEGLEALGADGLRDLLAYVCAGNTRFRFLDLGPAFTADSRKGMYRSLDSDGERLHLTKRGAVTAHGVPFRIAEPAKHPLGHDVMVLKGGVGANSYSRRLTRTVEVKAGFAAKQLHILGGIAGWGFPATVAKVPALKVTAHYAGGGTEEFTTHNSVEFADYNKVVDVPGSKLVAGFTERDQLRFYSHRLTREGVIEKVVFESFDNAVAPTTVAVTADLSDAPLAGGAEVATSGAARPVQLAATGDVKLPAATPFAWGAGTKVLLVGGGSAHDFNRFFNLADLATLRGAGLSAHYTENPGATARELKQADVAVLSVNRAEWATPELRMALLDFAKAGKGLVLLHAGVWYNFPDWPEYNRQLAGGGSRGHDRLGEFTVNLLKTDHPITKGVPASFKITDELYYMTPDPQGAAIEVLAETSPSEKFKKPHPSVWLVKHPQARIAGIALGHDGRAHSLPAFQQLLVNAVTWAAGRP